MPEVSIIAIIKKRLERGAFDLQVFNPLALKLQQMLNGNNYSAEDLSKVILKDQALTSNVLRVANSAFYAGLKPVKTIRSAIVRLGSKSIANLVMLVTQKQVYRSQGKPTQLLMNQLWGHALGAALAGRWLALRLGLKERAEEAFLAGLLHDIGKLFLMKVIGDLQKSGSIHRGIPTSIIHEVFEAMHCEQGELLMRHLNTPEIYCEVVARHHDAELSGGNVIVNLIRLADLTCQKLGIGLKNDPGLMLSTTDEAINLMANDLLLAELQVKLEKYKNSLDSLLGK
jgi:HD-like signal output (HDOD) protein